MKKRKTIQKAAAALAIVAMVGLTSGPVLAAEAPQSAEASQSAGMELDPVTAVGALVLAASMTAAGVTVTMAAREKDNKEE